MRLLALASLALLLSATVSAQSPPRIEERAALRSLEELEVMLTFTYEGATASQFRELVDANRDGRVSADERRANEGPYAQQLGRDAEDRLPHWLDGQPFGPADAGVQVRGLEGSASAEGPVVIVVTGKARSNATLAPGNHTWALQRADPGEGLRRVLDLRAPPGHVILRALNATWLGSCDAEAPENHTGEVVVLLQASPGACPLTAPVPPKRSAGAPWLLAAGALALALAARRR